MAASKRKAAQDHSVADRKSIKKPKVADTRKKVNKKKDDSSDFSSSEDSPPPDLLDFDVPEIEVPEDEDSDFSGSFLSIDSDEEDGGDGSPDSDDASPAPDLVQPGSKPDKPRRQKVEKEPLSEKPSAPNLQTSREAHLKQKVARDERKAAKPNADSIHRLKQIWGRLRRKSHVPLAERKALTTELFELIGGKEAEFVFKHDMVRVLQTALKYGDLPQKQSIARAFKGRYRELAEGKYSKFFISKILVTTFDRKDKEIRDLIVSEFYGHIRRLMRHPEASQLIDDLYRNFASPQQKARMLQEWYGQGLALANASKPAEDVSLRLVLQESPEKRKPLLEAVSSLIKPLVEKHMVGFGILHDAMYQYQSVLVQGSDEMTEFMELLKSDEDGNLLRNLAFTESGSKTVCMSIAQSTAKDRKYILKAFKGQWQILAMDPFGHLIILACFLTIDDTVQTWKAIFTELLDNVESIVNLASSNIARIPLLYLPANGSAKHLGSIYQKSISFLEEVVSSSQATSKKTASTRHAELLAAQSTLLMLHLTEAVPPLLESSNGSAFLRICIFGLQTPMPDVLSQIAERAKGNPSAPDHYVHKPWYGKLLKSLVQGGYYDVAEKKVIKMDPPLKFEDLLHHAIQGHEVEWAAGSGSFVILSLLESEDLTDRAGLQKVLRKNRKALVEASQKPRTEEKEDPKNSKTDRSKDLTTSYGLEQILKQLDLK